MERAKPALLLICDILFINFSLIIAVALWYAGFLFGEIREVQPIPESSWFWLLWAGIAASAVHTLVFAGFRLYSHLWRFAGIDELLKIFAATIISMIILFILDLLIIGNIAPMPRRVFVAAWFFLFFLSTVSRLGERILRRLAVTIGYLVSSKVGIKRVMVIGAGQTGIDLIRSMQNKPGRDKMPVLIVDDDPAKNNSHIMGIRIMGDITNIPYLAKAYAIDEITIAKPDADNAELKSILEFCTQTDCRLTILPPISEVAGVETGIRDVSISDLLYREEVKLDTEGIEAYIEGACVLVTGGGGTIGSELCRQLLNYKPGCILIIDIYENNAFDLVQELSEKNDARILFRVASIRDRARMNELFEEFKPDVVFHAAAHKHVSTMEDSPAEAIKNNVFGTLNVIKAAIANDCGRFVLISSDKAVNPTNIYGASKRAAEIVMQREAARGTGKTLLSAVRFGNVLGAAGSIIPKLKRQISQGGPVTIYNKKAERFFMTISEACQLVLQAGGLATKETSGHIFILDMGEPVNIDDLVHKLIRLSGLRPGEDIEVIYSEFLPGEKLKEELVLAEEQKSLKLTHYNKILEAVPLTRNYADFDAHMDRLRTFSERDPKRISQAFKDMNLNYEA